ncbi:zinc ABC transporter substrate-binding protein [Shimia sp. R11_0]|uniref:zinc ABC transporter substrate-binding protein n=1 Tax=Shimia sp. R11_0 TaxID=2821096 RepID=UPI001ADB80C4|nr:zinc ABC transporter substrate-binding protein [Shimia sp. R11_0]MBO9478678.1 zinc ABC transporter substrate-binding protein [Shimia sp. R11_0]
MRFAPFVVGAAMLALPARAEVPNVVTDILPVQALVAKVMQGVGTPTQLLPANQSPHSYAMRPSEARALQNADLVFWIGAELSPAMEEAIESLVSKGEAVSLLHLNGTRELEFRESETFLKLSLSEGGDDHDDHGHGDDDHDDHAKEGHDDHDHEDGDHEEHGHDDHADDTHDDHAHDDAHADEDHDDHDDHAHDSHDGHDHDGVDPHAWLDPQNAHFWLEAVAEKLAVADPENADTYRANAQAAQAELNTAIAAISKQLAPYGDHGFVVFHDAYQYFETRFGLNASGAILSGDGAAPSAARLQSVRTTLMENNISCVFIEPQFNDKVVRAISDGLSLHSEELDPLGAALEAPDYLVLIQQLANQFEACLSHS